MTELLWGKDHSSVTGMQKVGFNPQRLHQNPRVEDDVKDQSLIKFRRPAARLS